jgi:aspartyl-tRNA(Asn)/glutamyl-tRNA(Gln) amidotransferase subunit A
MIGEEILYLPITELGPRIRARLLSPIELTEAYLLRIAHYDKSLNAFAHLTPDLALQQARKAEAEVNSGKYRGPLHGIPYGAKDLFSTANIPTEWGAVPCKGQVFDRDATVVRKLRDAGAILLGKLACVEFAGCLGYRNADASATGPGRNPWDRSRWTGGSSSGSGAAVSSALVGFALGTETWGSILCPSAFCGITGLRPTYGRVSRAGGMVGAWTFDKVGPLARSAADCRAILEVIAGADPDDPSSAREPSGLPPRKVSPDSIRAAVIRLDFAKTKGAELEVKLAFDNALATLKSSGVRLVEAQLPNFPASEVAGLLITAEALSTFENFFRDGSVSKLHDPYAPFQMEINEGITGADVVKAWRMRRVLQDIMAEFYSHYDVIVTPNFMSVAPQISEDFTDALAYPDPVGAIGNACGLPAIALPAGFGAGRMPVSFQIMGAPWDESTLLDLGELYQSHTLFHQSRPPLS